VTTSHQADSTPAPAEYQLPVEGFQGTPEEIERQWFLKCYRGRGDTMLQLTWRAVIMGSLLGGILSLTNLYIGLKSGWTFGVAITACILSYAIWTTLYKIGLARSPMTILENNCMQTASSAAGASTGTTLISAFAAYMMLNNATLPIPVLMGWVFFLAILGVTMAVPMKRQMINTEQLRFPSGVAAAETLKALHSAGGRGMQSAKALGIAGLLAALSKFWLEGLHLISARLAPHQLSTHVQWLNTQIFGAAWTSRTVMISWEPMFIAAGAITGLRVCLSMLVGGVTCWMVFVPIMQQHGFISAAGGFRECVQWTLWGGTACMVTSGLLSFGLQWRSALRAFRSLGKMFAPSTTADDPVQAEMDSIETPAAWFIGGQLFGLLGLAYMGHLTFAMPLWETIVGVLLSFALALVACRVTGETDTTPIGAMGKITQLTFGAIAPGNMNVNLMAANITAGAAGSSAALMTDLKSGYLLGAHPRKQFLAQFSGIFVGTVVTVLCFTVLVPNAAALGTDQFPAPAAQTWKAVAEALGHGLASLHPIKVWSIVIGGLIGLILPVLSMLMPSKAKYIPSAAGIGLAWVFQWYYAVLFFTGALIGYLFDKKYHKLSEEYTFPVASGVIAGESLMGVALVLWENGPTVFRKLFCGG
jgi:uncharacterized oligopeptide transporter (OPT) family protein